MSRIICRIVEFNLSNIFVLEFNFLSYPTKHWKLLSTKTMMFKLTKILNTNNKL